VLTHLEEAITPEDIHAHMCNFVAKKDLFKDDEDVNDYLDESVLEVIDLSKKQIKAAGAVANAAKVKAVSTRGTPSDHEAARAEGREASFVARGINFSDNDKQELAAFDISPWLPINIQAYDAVLSRGVQCLRSIVNLHTYNPRPRAELARPTYHGDLSWEKNPAGERYKYSQSLPAEAAALAAEAATLKEEVAAEEAEAQANAERVAAGASAERSMANVMQPQGKFNFTSAPDAEMDEDDMKRELVTWLKDKMPGNIPGAAPGAVLEQNELEAMIYNTANKGITTLPDLVNDIIESGGLLAAELLPDSVYNDDYRKVPESRRDAIHAKLIKAAEDYAVEYMTEKER
jgi:hypothetical protein